MYLNNSSVMMIDTKFWSRFQLIGLKSMIHRGIIYFVVLKKQLIRRG
jgi:hypothetical protein